VKRSWLLPLFVVAACPGPRPRAAAPANKVQPLPSPDGAWALTVPVVSSGAGPGGVWMPTISDSAGTVFFADSLSDFVGALNVYWSWDGDGRAWLYNSDDGRVWFYELRGGLWHRGFWGAPPVRGTQRELMPPASLFPDCVSFDPDSVIQAPPVDSVFSIRRPGLSITVNYPAIALEIPGIGDSLGSWARSRMSGLKALAPFPGRAAPPLECLITFSAEPSPAGLVCILAACYEFTGGAHGMSLYRAFIFDPAEDRFIEPMTLLGDSSATAAFCRAVADTLERRLDGDTSWIEAGTLPDTANYHALLPLPDSAGSTAGFRVILDPYQVAPYAYGEQEVEIRRRL